jgi:tRNA dimethylallyltransferase
MIRALAITGPTASGKTAISIEVARHINAQIICCDSMQIYKYMDIGTAKPTPEEREAVPHHMTDFLMPTEDYSAQNYRADAISVAERIVGEGCVPLFVGGTGLYIDTLLRADLRDVPESDPEYHRIMMEKYSDDEGKEALWQRLYEIDPQSAEKTHKNNQRRVIRALEIFDKTGKTKSYFDELSRTASADISIGMMTVDFHDRENLYRRADMRVDQMISEGLVDEVRSLYDKGLLTPDSTAGQAIGYKELLEYLRGEDTLEDAIAKLKLSTRHYAKRQLTWFRHCDAIRLYADDEDGVMKDRDVLISEAICSTRELLL